MKLYRINKLTKRGGAIIKSHDVLASTDGEAIRRAESADCPVCEVLKDRKVVGSIL